MKKGFKAYVPFLVVGFLCIAAAVFDVFRPTSTVYAFFRIVDWFWAQCAFALGLLCIGIALILLCKRSRRNGKKGILPALCSVPMLLGAAAVLVFVFQGGMEPYMLHRFTNSADREHGFFGLTHYDIMGNSARNYYFQTGKYTYEYIFDAEDDEHMLGRLLWKTDGIAYRGNFYPYPDYTE